MRPPPVEAFGGNEDGMKRIGRVYVINLDRQARRWHRMQRELARLRGYGGAPLLGLTTRFSAIDGKADVEIPAHEVEPVYSLADQLYVEPDSLLAQSRPFEARDIRMSRPELAVAKSHLDTWRLVAASNEQFALILEDDVYFETGALQRIASGWRELTAQPEPFDMLYLSFREAASGAEKEPVSDALFRPVRGIWQMSGYVLSREGARKLIAAAPIRGPVDLWINYRFGELRVFATSQSIIQQRPDGGSDNAYSILPVLSTAGVLSKEKPNLYQPGKSPALVIAFTEPGRSADRLAMALSMLGYRCCSDVADLPVEERRALLAGDKSRVFDAYVNSVHSQADVNRALRKHPSARVVVEPGAAGWPGVGFANGAMLGIAFAQSGKLLTRKLDDTQSWSDLCRFLGCPKPEDAYPDSDLISGGLFSLTRGADSSILGIGSRTLKGDPSPWIVPPRRCLSHAAIPAPSTSGAARDGVHLRDPFARFDTGTWRALSDTFPGNRALFRPDNVALVPDGVALTLRRSPSVVREYSAGSIHTLASFRYGRFEAELKPAKGSGLVTGLFLHRYFPRQEIDIELLGKDTTRLLVNVYYNPGDEGAALNYGHRGTPILLDVGFDAAEDFHRYAIEWLPTCMRWFVDDKLIHERGSWDPTPVPHLPMEFFVNLWSAHSEELAGRLDLAALPANSVVRSVQIDGID